jgi:hypothetical protein
MKRGGEVKKQGAMRSAPSEQGDYVSEGRVSPSSPEENQYLCIGFLFLRILG